MAKKQRIHYVRFETPQKIALLVAGMVLMGGSGAVGYFLGQLRPRSLDAAYVSSAPLALDGSGTVNMPIPSGVFTFDGIFSADQSSVTLPPPPIGTPSALDIAPENGSVLPPAVEMLAEVAPAAAPPPEPALAPEVSEPSPFVEVGAEVDSPPDVLVQQGSVEVQRTAVDLPQPPATVTEVEQQPLMQAQSTERPATDSLSNTRTVSRGRPRPPASDSSGPQEVVVSRVSSHEDAEAARQALRGASLTATVRRSSDGEGFEVVLRTSGSDADRERQEQIGRRVLSDQ
ncbi:MAG: hypothetical protein KGO50_16715 [Myxococcales bacterium]|nr:hypothetical protein [Myxococcales bacterium]